MKKYNSDFEKLSAYLDGELPLSEKNELEEKLSFSPELRNKLEELRKVKALTSASHKKLNESPYFDARVMAEIRSAKHTPFIRKRWVPVFGLVMVTAALMLILKFNPQLINRLVEEQSTNLASFYKENLKPLLYAADLSNEDIFNFAFYKELPLDNKKEQYLQIGHDSKGVEYFEIKKSSYNTEENNYERFITALDLDEDEKEEVDSILQHYAAELQQQVLVNDRNTVAINPNLWNYNKAIAADLVRFASNVDEPELRKMIPMSDKYIHSPSMDKMVYEVKANNDNNYIFLTPDTIFSSWVNIESDEMQREIRIAKEEIKRANEIYKKANVELRKDLKRQERDLKKLNFVFNMDTLRINKDKLKRKDRFDVYIGDNKFRIEMQDFVIPEIEIPDMDSLSAHIDKLMKDVQVYTITSPRSPSKLSKRYNFQYGFKDSLRKANVPHMEKLDSAMRFNYNYYYDKNKRIDSLVSLYMPGFNFKQDSLTSYFKMYDDSTRFLYEKELQDQLKHMEIEIKRFREEMKDLRKDLNKEELKGEKPKTIRKPVEI